MWLFWIACSSDKPAEETLFFSPSEKGAYNVSSLEVNFINSAGEETPLQLWFPTLEENRDLYVYDDLFSGGALEKGEPICDKTLEVVMFSHGNQGIRYQSYFVTEHLASHGYIVAAPRHVRNSFFDYDNDSMSELVFRRPIDIRQAYDFLFEVEELAGCLEEEKGYAMIGHSFGGYTTVALSGASIDTTASEAHCTTENSGWLCDEVAEYEMANGAGVYDLSDDRIWAGIPMAPAGYEALIGGLELVDIPMMVLGGELDTSTTMQEQVQPIFAGMTNSDSVLGTLVRANHYTFSNACEILPTAEYCANDGIESSEAHALINTLTVAFLGLLKGDDRMTAYWPPETDELLWED